MSESRNFGPRTLRLRPQSTIACAALVGAALLGAAGCSGVAEAAPANGTGAAAVTVTSAAPSTSAAAAAGSGTSAAPSAGTANQTSAAAAGAPTSAAAKPAAASVPACGNGDLKLAEGYGTQSAPEQAWALVLTNVSRHSCTLQGYPGLAIAVGGRTINAVRVLNGFRGSSPQLSSPPLVTLAPGASAYSAVQWRLGKGPGCYPAGQGVIEATAPNDTDTIILTEHAAIGSGAVCSGLAVNPVVTEPYEP